MGLDLFDGCDGDDADLSKLEIDRDFARRLEHNKRREAHHRLQDLKSRGLVPSEEEEDSSSSDPDDDDEDLAGSGKKDVQFYDALVKVKRGDPVINQKDAKLFSSDDDDDDGEEEGEKKSRGPKKEKPLYLKDVMAKHLIEEGPEFEDKPLKHDAKIYKKEQVEDIKAFLEAEKEAFGEEDDEDIIKEKETSGDGIEEDGNAGEIEKKLDEYFGDDENLDENEMFLKNFFRNKMWVDKEKDKRLDLDDGIEIGVSEDEDELDKQDRYEAEYNFRHEEAGAADGGDRVWGHSRVMEGSVRRKESSRKVQRKSKEERMALAEHERKEELKHLKNLKKKEIQEKLEKIRAIAGIGEDGACKLDEDDLDEDFDPEEYDKKMKEMFGEAYYDAEDADPGFGSDNDGDVEKPDFDKEDELLGLAKGWNMEGSQEGFAAARERFLKRTGEEEDVPQNEEGKRKRKRKIGLREKVELDKELEEYYKLDYEDTIGDLKTRFKYKMVPANRYGLHPEEILMANDKDLNQYVSLKKLAPYRQDEWKVTYHQKLKKKVILEGEKSDSKKHNKKHKLKEDDSSKQDKKPKQEEMDGEEANKMSRKSKRRRRQAELKLSRSRLLAYGRIPSKPAKKH